MVMTSAVLALVMAVTEPPRRDKVADACRRTRSGRTAGHCPEVDLGPLDALRLLMPGERAEAVLHRRNGSATRVVIRVEEVREVGWWPPEGAAVIEARTTPLPESPPSTTAQQASLALDGDLCVLLGLPLMAVLGASASLRRVALVPDAA